MRFRSARSRRARVVLAVVALAGAGCWGKAPAIRTWTLLPPAPASPTDGQGPRIGVARFSAAGPLRTTSLTWRTARSSEVHRRALDEWIDYPDRMLEERALLALHASGRFGAVRRAPPRRDLDAILAARLIEFVEWEDSSGSEARVAVRWSLEDGAGAVLSQGLARATAAARSERAEDVVAAFGQACGQVADQLVAAVAGALTETGTP